MELKKAAQQALEAMEVWRDSLFDENALPGWRFSVLGEKAITALRDALANTQDWDEIEALRASLREHMAEIHRLRVAGQQALEALEQDNPAGRTATITSLRTVLEPVTDHHEKEGNKLAPPLAWYDPSNGVISTDKDDPRFTPLGQLWPLYRPADTGKTSDQSEDSLKMVASVREDRTVEPVAYCTLEQLVHLKLTVPSDDKIPLYTAPPKREPLTEQELEPIRRRMMMEAYNAADDCDDKAFEALRVAPEPVTDCHGLEQARAVAFSNLLANFGVSSADSDVNVAYLHKQLDDFLMAAIGCSKEGGNLSPPLESEACEYPRCLSSSGCERQCPAFPRCKDADTGKTSDHIPDAGKMVTSVREDRTVEPVGYGVFEDGNLHDSFRLEHEAKLFAALKGEHAEVHALYLAQPKREPLTEEQIAAIDWKDGETLHDFARAIERAHGIGGEE